MILNPSQIILFSILSSFSETMKLDEEATLKNILQDNEGAQSYLQLALLFEKGYSQDEYDEMCQLLNKAYSNIGMSLEALREDLKKAVKEG